MNTENTAIERSNDSKVSIVNDRGKIRLLVSFNGKRLSVSLGLDYTPKKLKIAHKIADQIDADILFNRFNGDLKKYRPGYNANLVLVQSQSNVIEIKPKHGYSIKDCWELYKKHKKASIAEAQQKTWWPRIDRFISILESEDLLSINQASDALEYLLETYTYGTLRNILKDFRTAINLAIDLGKYEGKNYYANILKTFPKSEKKEIESYTKKDVTAILDAFKSDKYCSNKSAYKHSYYADLVEFRFMTGCRPSEAFALTWDDVYYQDNNLWIKFNKAYRDGCLHPHTKTKEIRVFPCYPQLKIFIETIIKIPNKNNLIFPSRGDLTYINGSDFLRRYWHTIVRDNLAKDGLISKYLPFYDERHTCATFLIQLGVDIQTIAKMLGNSPDILLKYYLASRENLNHLPELF